MERSQRTCASGECGTGKTEVKAHIVQIVDQPSQIFALQIWSSIFVFVSAEEADELVVEMRRSSVEIAEFLQGIERGHGDDATTTRIADKNDGPRPCVHTVPSLALSGGRAGSAKGQRARSQDPGLCTI